jgi:hypothetical protein
MLTPAFLASNNVNASKRSNVLVCFVGSSNSLQNHADTLQIRMALATMVSTGGVSCKVLHARTPAVPMLTLSGSALDGT